MGRISKLFSFLAVAGLTAGAAHAQVQERQGPDWRSFKQNRFLQDNGAQQAQQWNQNQARRGAGYVREVDPTGQAGYYRDDYTQPQGWQTQGQAGWYQQAQWQPQQQATYGDAGFQQAQWQEQPARDQHGYYESAYDWQTDAQWFDQWHEGTR